MMILVTGGTGFVGRSLISRLLEGSYQVAVTSRRGNNNQFHENVKKYHTKDISTSTNWSGVFEQVDVVIHAAARVHIMDDSVADPLAEFRKVNVGGTLNLARQAAQSGVKRFIFISSIKVNGEMTTIDRLFKSDDKCIPTDPYGLSKYEAEQGLLAIARETGMEVVIIRPPLVYGPGVRANFFSMMKWIYKGIPLPLGAINNRRSFVALDNLVSFIINCINHPKAANEVFLISDGEDVSTSELLKKVAKAFGKKSLLLSVPTSLMTFTAKLIGKGEVATRLFSSLQVDSSKAQDLLGWTPVTTMDEQLKKTAEAYLKNEKTL